MLIVLILIVENQQIFTGKKLEDLSPSTHNMDVPNVVKTEYTLLNIDDDFMNLIDSTGGAKDDVKVPEGEVGDQIQELFDDGKEVLVTVVSAMGEEHALSAKVAPEGVSFILLCVLETRVHLADLAFFLFPPCLFMQGK